MKRQGLSISGLIVLAVFFTACDRAEPPEAVLQTVRTGRVEACRSEEGPRYAAALSPASQVNLVFKSPGVVKSILQVRGDDGRARDIQAGDRVARGSVLAQVRSTEYEQQVLKARAGLRNAEAQLTQAMAGLEEARLSYERARTLFHQASLTKPPYDQARARHEAARAGVEAARAGVEAAATTLWEAKLALDDTSLRSPINGWVLARTLEVGALAGTGGPGFSLIDTHLVKAVFAVPDTALGRVQKGETLPIAIHAVSRPIKGVVTAISPQADPRSRVFSVEVTLRNPDEDLRPGMIGHLILREEEETRGRPVVPLEAVVRSPNRPDGYALFRIERRDGRTYAAARDIQIGAIRGNLLEVMEGAAPGDPIVVTGASMIRDGEEVRVLGEEREAGHGPQE